MMKKNMKLLAVMMILSAGSSYLICSNSDSSPNNETSVSTQAQQMVKEAFKSAVDLIAAPYLGESLRTKKEVSWNNRLSSENNQIPMENAIKSINSSLMKLGQAIGQVEGIKQIVKVASDTVKFFAEKSTTGSSYTINRKVFLPIVNSLKLAVTVPTQLAVRASMMAGDVAAGAVMGAGSGLAASLGVVGSAGTQFVSHATWTGVMKDFSLRVVIALSGIVDAPVLVAYGAGHGISRAIVVSYTQGRDNVGLGYAQPDNGSFADQFNPVPADKVQTANDLYNNFNKAWQKYNDVQDNSQEGQDNTKEVSKASDASRAAWDDYQSHMNTLTYDEQGQHYSQTNQEHYSPRTQNY